MIPDTDLFHKALRLAAWAHYGQITKFGDPYITHPVAASYEIMAASAAGESADFELAALCAILHDVVEKSDVTLHSIKKDFGKKVAAGVGAMTKKSDIPKEEQLKESLMRILEQPKEVAMAKLADRISSMLPPPANWSKTKIETIVSNAELIRELLGDSSPYLSKRLKGKIGLYRAVLEMKR